MGGNLLSRRWTFAVVVASGAFLSVGQQVSSFQSNGVSGGVLNPVYFRSNGGERLRDVYELFASLNETRFKELVRELNPILPDSIGLDSQLPFSRIVVLPDPERVDIPFGWFPYEIRMQVINRSRLSEEARMYLESQLK